MNMWKCFRQVKYSKGCLKLPLQGLWIKKSQLPSGVGILLSLDIIVLEILRILWSSLKRRYCLLEFLLSASFTAIILVQIFLWHKVILLLWICIFISPTEIVESYVSLFLCQLTYFTVHVLQLENSHESQTKLFLMHRH